MVYYILTFLYIFLFFCIKEKKNKNQEIKQENVKVEEKKPIIFHSLNFFRIWFIYEIVQSHLALPLELNCKYVGHIDYFFIVSGFLLFMHLDKSQSCFDFMKNKIVKWYPLMILGILIRLCIRQKFDKYAFFSETLFLSLTGIGPVGINMPDWFLSVLLWSTVFYFLMFKAFNKELSNFLLFSTVALSSFALSKEVFGLVDRHVVWGILCVGLGIIAAQFYNAILNGKRAELPGKFSDKILKLVITGFEVLAILSSIFCNKLIYVIAAMFFLVLLMTLNKGYISSFLNKNIFTKLGSYVMAVFLTHGFVTNEVLRVLVENHPIILQHKTLAVILTYIAVIIVAVLSQHIVGNKVKIIKKYL